MGFYKSLLIFLAHSSWLCSINIDDTKRWMKCTKGGFYPTLIAHCVRKTVGTVQIQGEHHDGYQP